MNPLTRATYWLAFLNAVPGGASRVVDELRAVGARGIAPRLGVGGGRDPGATKENLKKYADAGLEVSAWQYSYPGHAVTEIDLFRRVRDEAGVTRFIVNAEIEWTHATSDDARRYVDALRVGLPGCWIAHAPFALPIAHADFPYVGFSGLDAALPQVYPHEFGGPSPASWWARYQSELATFRARHPECASQPWYPIFDLYGAQLGPAWRTKSPPRSWSRADLDFSLEALADCEWPSFYTIDAALASGAWADVVAACRDLPPATLPAEPIGLPADPRGGVVADVEQGLEIMFPEAHELAWHARWRDLRIPEAA